MEADAEDIDMFEFNEELEPTYTQYAPRAQKRKFDSYQAGITGYNPTPDAGTVVPILELLPPELVVEVARQYGKIAGASGILNLSLTNHYMHNLLRPALWDCALNVRDIQFKDYEDYTFKDSFCSALHWAAYYGKLDLVKWILRKNRCTDSLFIPKPCEPDFSFFSMQNANALQCAAAGGQNAVLEHLLTSDIDEGVPSPLYIAALYGQLETVKFLFAKGAKYENKRKATDKEGPLWPTPVYPAIDGYCRLHNGSITAEVILIPTEHMHE